MSAIETTLERENEDGDGYLTIPILATATWRDGEYEDLSVKDTRTGEPVEVTDAEADRIYREMDRASEPAPDEAYDRMVDRRIGG